MKYIDDLLSRDSLTNTAERALNILKADEEVKKIEEKNENFENNIEKIRSAENPDDLIRAVKDSIFGAKGVLSY